MRLYRLLTGPDDASFCHRVSEALNHGWQLHEGPTLSLGPDGRVVCGQAIVKEVAGDYEPELKLSEQ